MTGGQLFQHHPSTEKIKGPTQKSRTLTDLHVCQISDVVISQPLHVETEFDHDTTR